MNAQKLFLEAFDDTHAASEKFLFIGGDNATSGQIREIRNHLYSALGKLEKADSLISREREGK